MCLSVLLRPGPRSQLVLVIMWCQQSWKASVLMSMAAPSRETVLGLDQLPQSEHAATQPAGPRAAQGMEFLPHWPL